MPLPLPTPLPLPLEFAAMLSLPPMLVDARDRSKCAGLLLLVVITVVNVALVGDLDPSVLVAKADVGVVVVVAALLAVVLVAIPLPFPFILELAGVIEIVVAVVGKPAISALVVEGSREGDIDVAVGVVVVLLLVLSL